MRLIDADKFKQQVTAATVACIILVEKANKMMELIDMQPAANQPDGWISVSERLPENWVNVLTYDNYGNVHMMAHHESYESPFGIDKDNARFYEVQGWMPLPEPPKED